MKRFVLSVVGLLSSGYIMAQHISGAMDSELPLRAVRLTGRISMLVFVAVLTVPVVFPRLSKYSMKLFLAFIVTLTGLFAAVTWFAIANHGQNLFPAGRSLQDAGGWTAVIAIYTLVYGLTTIGLIARRPSPGKVIRVADRVAITFIGFMFLATYVPLISRSLWFVLPTLLLCTALGTYWYNVITSRNNLSSQ